MQQKTYIFVPVLDAQFLCGDEIVEVLVLLLLNTAERVNHAAGQFDLKIERASRSTATREIHRLYLLEANVQRRLVNVDESTLERIEETGSCLVGTSDCRCLVVPASLDIETMKYLRPITC